MQENCQVLADNKNADNGHFLCKLVATVEKTLSELVNERIEVLGISKAELARRTGLSRTYITDIANKTAPTQSGQYNLPPETIKKIAKALEIKESEILEAIGFEIEDETTPETIQAVGFEGLDEADLEEIARFIQFRKSQKKKNE